jgi:hypothetical protein
MAAQVFLHPIAQQRHLLETVSNLRTRGFVVPDQPGKRFVRAYPDMSDAAVDAMFRRGMRTLFADWINFKETK